MSDSCDNILFDFCRTRSWNSWNSIKWNLKQEKLHTTTAINHGSGIYHRKFLPLKYRLVLAEWSSRTIPQQTIETNLFFVHHFEKMVLNKNKLEKIINEVKP